MTNETVEVDEQNHSITSAVSQRYAHAVTNGEQLCCPTGYNHEDLGQFIPEPVLKGILWLRNSGLPFNCSTGGSGLGHWFGWRDQLL